MYATMLLIRCGKNLSIWLCNEPESQNKTTQTLLIDMFGYMKFFGVKNVVIVANSVAAIHLTQ